MMDELMTFPEALACAQNGGLKIARKGWNGSGQHVRQAAGAQVTLSDRKTVEYVHIEPFMVLRNAQGQYVPWAPSQGDMAADDWYEVMT